MAGRLNMLGLGFSFGAKDDGVVKQQKQITQNFTLMRDAVAKLNTIASGSRVNSFLGAISVHKLGQIQRGIAGLVTKGGQLTTGFESTLFQHQRTARMLGHNYGLVGEELEKFASGAAGLAVSLNIGVEQAAQAMKMWGRHANELRKVGVKSASDLARFAEVTKLDPEKFTYSLKMMQSALRMTEDDIKNVVGSFNEMGAVTGDRSGALGSMEEILKSLQEQAALMGYNLDSSELARFAKETARAAAGLYATGLDAEQARTQALGLAAALVKSRKDLGNLFAGTAEDVPKMIEDLSIFTGSADEALKLMAQGPAGVMEGLAKIAKDVKASGGNADEVFNLLRARLEEAFGEEQAKALQVYFRNFVDGTAEAARAAEAMGRVKEATGGVTDAIANHKVNRTLQEHFDYAENLFMTRMRRISKAGPEFVKASRVAFQDFGDLVAGLVAHGGPLGKLAEMVSSFSSIGAKAFLPANLVPYTVLFGKLVEEMGPMVGFLHAIGINLFSVKGLFLGGIAAIGLQYASLLMETKDTGKAFDLLLVKLRGWWDVAKDWINKGLNLAARGMERLAEKVREIDWTSMFEKGMAAIHDFVMGLFGDRTANEFANTIGGNLSRIMMAAWDIAKTIMVSAVKGWWRHTFGIWDDEFVSFEGKLKKSVHSIAITLGGLFAFSSTARYGAAWGIDKLFQFAGGRIAKRRAALAAAEAAGSAASGAAGKGGLLSRMARKGGRGFLALPAAAGRGVLGAGGMLGRGVKGLGRILTESSEWKAAKWLGGKSMQAGRWAGRGIGQLGSRVGRSIGRAGADAAAASGRAISTTLSKVFGNEGLIPLRAFGKRIGQLGGSLGSLASRGVGGAIGALSRLGARTLELGGRLGSLIMGPLARFGSSIGNLVMGPLTTLGQKTMEYVIGPLASKAASVGRFAGNLVDRVMPFMRRGALALVGGMRWAGGAIQAAAGFARGSLIGKLGLVAAVGLASWQIGKFINDLEIGGKSVGEWVQTLFEKIADAWNWMKNAVSNFLKGGATTAVEHIRREFYSGRTYSTAQGTERAEDDVRGIMTVIRRFEAGTMTAENLRFFSELVTQSQKAQQAWTRAMSLELGMSEEKVAELFRRILRFQREKDPVTPSDAAPEDPTEKENRNLLAELQAAGEKIVDAGKSMLGIHHGQDLDDPPIMIEPMPDGGYGMMGSVIDSEAAEKALKNLEEAGKALQAAADVWATMGESLGSRLEILGQHPMFTHFGEQVERLGTVINTLSMGRSLIAAQDDQKDAWACAAARLGGMSSVRDDDRTPPAEDVRPPPSAEVPAEVPAVPELLGDAARLDALINAVNYPEWAKDYMPRLVKLLDSLGDELGKTQARSQRESRRFHAGRGLQDNSIRARI